MTSTDRSTENAILYNELGNPIFGVSSYMASTNGSIATGTTAATINSIAYLFHPNTNAKRLEINRIDISFTGGAALGTGVVTIRGARITAENGTPGGTSQTINPCEIGDTASTATFRTGANTPTRSAGDLMTFNFSGSASSLYTWVSDISGKPIIIRASQAEGFEIRTVIQTALTTAAQISVTFYWTEQ